MIIIIIIILPLIFLFLLLLLGLQITNLVYLFISLYYRTVACIRLSKIHEGCLLLMKFETAKLIYWKWLFCISNISVFTKSATALSSSLVLLELHVTKNSLETHKNKIKKNTNAKKEVMRDSYEEHCART